MEKEQRGHGTPKRILLRTGDALIEMTKDNLAKSDIESYCDIGARQVTLATGVNRGLNELDKMMIKAFSI